MPRFEALDMTFVVDTPQTTEPEYVCVDGTLQGTEGTDALVCKEPNPQEPADPTPVLAIGGVLLAVGAMAGIAGALVERHHRTHNPS